MSIGTMAAAFVGSVDVHLIAENLVWMCDQSSCKVMNDQRTRVRAGDVVAARARASSSSDPHLLLELLIDCAYLNVIICLIYKAPPHRARITRVGCGILHRYVHIYGASGKS